jgi:hypothetical protein
MLKCSSKIIGIFCKILIEVQVNFKTKYFPSFSKKIHNVHMILSKSTLLENSFRDAGIIDTAFPYVLLEDSLSSALVMLNSQMLDRIVVLDSKHHLFGVLDRELVLREFLPSKNTIPQQILSQDKWLNQRAAEAIRATAKESLYDFSHVIRKTRSFKREEFLFYGINYFLSHGYCLTDDLIVIDDDSHISGTVSGKSILKYFLSCTDLDSFSDSLADAIDFDSDVAAESVTCLSNEFLETGLYAITHTAAICILIKKRNKLIGILSREMISENVHSLYPDLLNYPMDRFMRKIIESEILESGISLMNLCDHLINSREGFVVVKEKKMGKTNQRGSSNLEYKVISVKSFLGFLFRKLDS